MITVTLNAAAHVRSSAQSLKDQTFTDYEWIVVDGVSRDDTVAIAESMAIPNTRIHVGKDRGIYDAMNRGVAMATGEWLYFLNAGDSLAGPRVLEQVNALVQRRTKLRLVHGNIMHLEANRRLYERTSYVRRSLFVFEELNHQAVFAHRSLFEKLGSFDLRYPICADFDWLVRVFQSGAPTAHIDVTVANFLDGGVHTLSTERLAAERRMLRQHYVGPARLAAGNFLARVRRRLRLMSGWMREVR